MSIDDSLVKLPRHELERQIDEELKKPALEVDTKKLAEMLLLLYGPLTEEQQDMIDRIWQKLAETIDELKNPAGDDNIQ